MRKRHWNKRILINLTQQRLHLNIFSLNKKGTIDRTKQNVYRHIHVLSSLLKYCKFTVTISYNTETQLLLCFCVLILSLISSRISLALFSLVLFQCNTADVADETHLNRNPAFQQSECVTTPSRISHPLSGVHLVVWNSIMTYQIFFRPVRSCSGYIYTLTVFCLF